MKSLSSHLIKFIFYCFLILLALSNLFSFRIFSFLPTSDLLKMIYGIIEFAIVVLFCLPLMIEQLEQIETVLPSLLNNKPAIYGFIFSLFILIIAMYDTGTKAFYPDRFLSENLPWMAKVSGCFFILFVVSFVVLLIYVLINRKKLIQKRINLFQDV